MMRFLIGCVCLLIGYTAWGAQKPYFQQETNYQIHVRLDDSRNELFADERIEYINNSPDALPFIYFHLWPNAYKNNNTALAKQLLSNGSLTFHYAAEEDRGYIDQLDFKINGETAKWEFAGDTIDVCRIWLKQPLLPGQRIIITTPFHVKIPLGKFSRLGHLGQQYQITQWYPKPAVYDRNGWNQMPFLNQGEFYSEFGSFDVFITLPRNYVLGATGDLTDTPQEEEFLQKKNDETLQWAKEYERTGITKEGFPVSDTLTKTLHYHQDQVHDFAWFCDKRYHVLKGTMETPHRHNKVTTWLMFTESQAELWLKATPYIQDAITFYSLWNGDYPYHQVTAVDGGLSAGSGMEYPNITVIGNVTSAFTLETVIMHEVGHNWFYGMLGSNERRNPWMDEGLNSFDENRYIKTKYPDAKLLGTGYDFFGKAFDLNRYDHKHLSYLEYQFSAAKEEDQPIQLPAPDYTSFNYAGIVYAKTALSFDYLMAYLGTNTMDAAMQQYFETWKFKHPQPNDLRKILENVSGKDLSWFFDDLINTTKKLDYTILASLPVANGYSVAVRNSGQIKGPVALCGIKNNALRGIVWYDGFWGTEVLSFPPVAEGIDYFMIDYNSDMPEIDRNNNILRTHGIL
ncbi:MAG TPA: M1 family metallopeptidase, partial [Bacteroidia bacterium]|nr:M1 family metallopeptidase [Bacteroidia bacterium]